MACLLNTNLHVLQLLYCQYIIISLGSKMQPNFKFNLILLDRLFLLVARYVRHLMGHWVDNNMDKYNLAIARALSSEMLSLSGLT